MTIQVAAKLPNDLVEAVDDLVEHGTFANRSQAIRQGLETLLATQRREALEETYRRAYARHPETEEELAEASRLAIASIEEEPWEPWW